MTSDNQTPELFGATPWQTVGPFFHYALPYKGGGDLVGSSERGARLDLVPRAHDHLHRRPARGPVQGRVIEISGRVFDGEAQPMPDALIEIWQANAAGRHDGGDSDFIGFGRCATTDDGEFSFRTIFPGRVPSHDRRLQAPHLAVSLFARGILRRLVTRIYFAGGEGLDEDPILALVPAERRNTLIASRAADGSAYRFDIHAQGPHETVFFEF